MDTHLTGNTTVDQLLGITGTLVTLMSAVATFFNGRIRERQSAGETVGSSTLKAVAALNVLAVNIDKAKQLFELARTGLGTATTPRPGFPCPTCGVVIPKDGEPSEPAAPALAAPPAEAEVEAPAEGQ